MLLKRRGFTSLYVLILLTVIMLQVIVIFESVNNASNTKQNNNYFIKHSSKVLSIKNGVISEINNQLSYISSGEELKEFIPLLNANLDTFKTDNNCKFQITSLSNTVFEFNTITKLNSSSNYDVKFTFYIEIYVGTDNLYHSKLRGVIK